MFPILCGERPRLRKTAVPSLNRQSHSSTHATGIHEHLLCAGPALSIITEVSCPPESPGGGGTQD